MLPSTISRFLRLEVSALREFPGEGGRLKKAKEKKGEKVMRDPVPPALIPCSDYMMIVEERERGSRKKRKRGGGWRSHIFFPSAKWDKKKGGRGGLRARLPYPY